MMTFSLQATALSSAKLLCSTKQRIAWLKRGYQHRHRHRPLHLVPLKVMVVLIAKEEDSSDVDQVALLLFSDGHVGR
jgi:hypothetical protein